MNPEIQAWIEQVLAPMWLPTSKVLLILGGSYLLLRGIDFTFERLRAFVDDKDPDVYSDAEKRAERVTLVLGILSRVVIGTIAIINLLEILGINIVPLITGAGVVGVVVGFGAQSLVKDFLVGLFVLFEDQYRIGDIVRVDNLMGEVEQLNLRTTTLRDLNGNVHIIPNGSITRVTVLTKNWSRAFLDIRVSYTADADQAREILRQVGQQFRQEEYWQRVTLEDLQILGVEELGENAVILRAMMKTLPGKQWEVMRELRRRIKHSFDEAGVRFPVYLLPLVIPNADDHG